MIYCTQKHRECGVADGELNMHVNMHKRECVGASQCMCVIFWEYPCDVIIIIIMSVAAAFVFYGIG